MTRSALDDVPGLGQTRRKALLKRFGSLKRLRAASVEDVVEVPGFGPRLAQAVVDALAAPDAKRTSDRQTTPAVNTATGELLDEESDSGGEEQR